MSGSSAQVFVNGLPAGWTDVGTLTSDDEQPTYPRVVRTPAMTLGSMTFTWTGYTPPPEMLGLDLAAAPPPLYAITTYSTRPRRLLTGRRGNRRRVDHARELRMATWKRRRQRRHGIPAATVLTGLYFPHLRMELT